MSELDEIKKKKLEELKQQQGALNQEVQEQLQLQEQIQQLEAVVKQIFTKEALARYGNFKAAHPQKALQLLVVLGQTIQSGQIKTIDDDNLKDILRKLPSEKKSFRIIKK